MIKRTFDISFALLGLVFLSPVFILVSIMICINMGLPLIFRQKRVGMHGELFTLYKFRTMHNTNEKNYITVKGEKRITSLGAFLRKYKIDELPSLLNVVTGKMSFVGPRPDMPGYADQLKGEDRVVLNLRPGITGPASLKYANEEELLADQEDPKKYNDEIIFPDKVRINKEYYFNHSIGGDIMIIIKTIFRKY